MSEHPLRQQLHNEIHARPFERVGAPAQVSHQVMLVSPSESQQAFEHLSELLGNLHLPPPAMGSMFHTEQIGPVRLRWERHGEFVSYTFITHEVLGPEDPLFERCACDRVSAEWLARIPGQRLCANHVAVMPEGELGCDTLPDFSAVLDIDALVGSDVADGHAQVFTDLRIAPDGFTRFIVLSKAMSARRRGRLVQRLLEIETYRLLSLLTLPVARELTPQLNRYEQDLVSIMDAIGSNGGAEDAEPNRDHKTLDRLTLLASAVEGVYAASHGRFTAANAYYDLVNRRVTELHEKPIFGLQTIGQFLERRLAPAMQTCAWAARRQQALSERVSRCSNLLRTRVEVAMQQQNRSLLASMNRRQFLQLRLQQTVEGLSVAAITYYMASLVGHLFEAAEPWLHIKPKLAEGISIPIIALIVWIALQRMHHRLERASEAR
ncbi:MAG: DUF3422 domain-containing protein [Thiomonas arsenitoxydans]|uniref:DUF3422 domain-containing protein n=1 Tax=Thiomonas arsenitoxydans (strain DSM 22701 / CIP 110005 / 3As) TaxID=426114 RepID=A0A8I1MZD2_THIA3|nr:MULTISPECIES: DUF3422 domain-containing protein [Thiomonas]MBN8744767.1 DUF3422 domain-containing protein [Thiomonas arsenitoxydans]ODU96383.1 MAG: hypothetical protein ABT24_09090 [Thiomonas sp. SCN 64-16]